MAFSPAREELRRLWRELRGPRTTPGRAAASVALGLLAGWAPLHGGQALAVAAACIWFQLDGLAALVALVISLFAKPIVLRYAVAISPLAGTAAGTATAAGAGTVVAITGGAIAGALVALLPRAKPRAPYRLPPDAPEWVRASERVATRYAAPYSPRALERTRFHYLRTKLLGDPVARLLADVAGEAPRALGDVLDIGAGRGQIALLLLELGRASSVRGVDWDARKVAAAQRAASAAGEGEPGAAPLDAAFTCGDVRTAPLLPADTVLLVDILHYFRVEEQDAILDRAAAAVRPGGRLLVREADTERGWRSAATLAEERFFTFVRFNRGERVRFRPVRDIVARLEAAGLRCEVLPAWGGTPFSNVLVVAQKPRAGPRSLSSPAATR